ncbi:flagellar brake domain-containing protein [Paraglaciecola sp. 2405UD69-4]|uniref:flagellar brake domain-containing protein n=1 Tax=Paraglaciecola sp. 2405UD69-4 TaxID=3391836 RepID=UPI0039C98088
MAILTEKIGITNEDLRKIRSMRPGQPVDLQVTTASTTKRVKTEFVGIDGTRSLIVRYPDESKWGSLGDAIFKDKSLIMRYILEDETGEIIAFKVNVVLVLTKPSHLIFTSFPLAIQSHDLRSEKRAQTRIVTKVTDVETKENICEVIVIDISVHGCRIKVDKKFVSNKLRLRERINLEFTNADNKKVDLVGVIMNFKYDEVNFYCGIKFETEEQVVEQLLKGLMLALE